MPRATRAAIWSAVVHQAGLRWLGRKTKSFSGYDLAESSYADAASVSVAGDTIVEQTEITYDAASNATQNTVKQRYHNATGTGELNGSSGVQP